MSGDLSPRHDVRGQRRTKATVSNWSTEAHSSLRERIEGGTCLKDELLRYAISAKAHLSRCGAIELFGSPIMWRARSRKPLMAADGFSDIMGAVQEGEAIARFSACSQGSADVCVVLCLRIPLLLDMEVDPAPTDPR
jgi:hypothetical protein